MAGDRLSEKIKKESFLIKETGLGRFFQKIHQLFKKESETDIKLEGRIHELNHATNLILLNLQNLKKECQNKLEKKLLTFLDGAIDPLIKEIMRGQMLLTKKERPETQVKAVHRCGELLEKAQVWINLTLESSEDLTLLIHQALLDHQITEFQICIDRDIQLIWDYLDHALTELHIPSDTKSILKSSLEPELTVYIERLENLKIAPKDLSLEEISAWRMKVNYVRSKYFASTLHLIDTFASEFHPPLEPRD